VNDSLCVVCPPCVASDPPCEVPCYEGPCSSAPSSGVVVASSTPSRDAAVMATGIVAGTLLVAAVRTASLGRPLVRESRGRR